MISAGVWQYNVPIWRAPIVTQGFRWLLVLVLIGTVLGGARLLAGSLGAFTGLTDAYAWGVWKTLNAMALTALGSAALSVGFCTWVLGRQHLAIVMRTAAVVSMLFYGTGLLGIATDVGRPWNFWNALLPWRWNMESAMWEVSMAMPMYAFVFLLFECSPIVVERLWFNGTPRMKAIVQRWRPRMRKIYPFMITGAMVVPMMHQASLGSLLLLAGDKVHPLWQTDMLPVLYLVQAGICGFGSVILFLMGAGLVWRRPLDMKVLGELGSLLSWLTLGWVAVRYLDLVKNGCWSAAFQADPYAALFWLENVLALVPALLLRNARLRETPRSLFTLAVIATIGGLMYRFNPTTIAFDPGEGFVYFPSVPELFITIGLIAFAVILFSVAVKLFAVLPAPLDSWRRMVQDVKDRDPSFVGDEYGNPLDD